MSLSLPNRRQVLHWLGILMLLAIVVPFVVYAVPGFIGGEASYVVLSGSMEPAISTGDAIIVDNVEPTSIEEGDVITYTRSEGETPTTHRVTEVLEQDGTSAFLTKGDANDQPDASPVSESQVQGKVVLTLPYIGYVVNFVNTPLGFVTLVVVPFLLLLGSEFSSFREKEQKASTVNSGLIPGDFMSNTTNSVDEPNTKTISQSGPVSDHGEVDERVDDDTIAIARSDLRLSLVLLFGITVYASWVVTYIQEPWSFAVVFASALGLLLVGIMYYFAGSQATSQMRGDEGDPVDRSEKPGNTDAIDSEKRTGEKQNHSAPGSAIDESPAKSEDLTDLTESSTRTDGGGSAVTDKSDDDEI